MKVAVIGCTSSEIISSCNLTILSLSKGGHRVYGIVAPPQSSEQSSEITTEKDLLAKSGVVQTFTIEKFDYSSITQANADAVNAHIRDISPSLVIMPSWKSSNYMRKILARVSLIACRGIGTVLMYEQDANKTDFVPSVIFEVSPEPASIGHQNGTSKTGTTIKGVVQNAGNMEERDFTNDSMLKHGNPEIIIRPDTIKEKFESHRTLLLEEGGLF